MSNLFMILLIIVVVWVMIGLFLFSARFASSLKNNPKSISSIEGKYIDNIKPNFRDFFWRFCLPTFLMILILSIVNAISRESTQSFFILCARIFSELLIWSIWVLVAFLFFSSLIGFYLNIRLHDGNILSKMHNTFRVRRRCYHGIAKQRGFLKTGLVLAPLLSVASYFIFTDLILPVSAFFWWIVFSDVSVHINPPACLLLAKSENRTLILQEVISQTIRTATVVSLLDLDTYSDQYWARAGGSDVLRALPGEDWTKIVLEFGEIVEVIVLDGREVSSNVELEMSLLAHPKLAVRTLIVIDGGSPSKAQNADLLAELTRVGANIIKSERLQSALCNAFGLPDYYT